MISRFPKVFAFSNATCYRYGAESKDAAPGGEIVAADSPIGRLGVTARGLYTSRIQFTHSLKTHGLVTQPLNL
jgi:hypothetical protein